MGLTWKDIVTTIFAAMTFGLFYAMSKNMQLPLITGYRGAILVLGVFGIAMCALSGGATTTGPFITIASILGIASLIFIIYGLITGAEIAFTLLTISIIALWIISTFRHLIQA